MPETQTASDMLRDNLNASHLILPHHSNGLRDASSSNELMQNITTQTYPA